jgi:hypothetical protein
MIRKILLTSAALALATSAAYAGPKITLVNNNRNVSVEPGKNIANPGSLVQFPGTYQFNNFATKYKNGLYFCCYGGTLSGPSSFFGVAYAQASGWTQATNAAVTKLSAAVGYVSGDHTATLTLYADSGSGSPGKALASKKGTTTQFFGGCCGVLTVKIKSTNLTAGNTYWIGITTGGANFEAAPESTIDQVNAHPVAFSSNGGTTWTGATSVLAVSVAAK